MQKWHKKFRFLFICLFTILSFIAFLMLPGYSELEEISFVSLYSHGQKAYPMVHMRQTMYKLHWFTLRNLSMNFPLINKHVRNSSCVIETDGVSARSTMVAKGFLYHMIPQGDDLYVSERPVGQGDLFRWRDGIATRLPAPEAAALRCSYLQYKTDQCLAQGWSYFDESPLKDEIGIDLYDPGVRGSRDLPITLALVDKPIRIRFSLNPRSFPTAPPPDQTLIITIDYAIDRMFTTAFPYKKVIKGLKIKDWEAFCKE